MKKVLIVVDMQRDFVDGALGTREAQAIVPLVTAKIRGFEGPVFATLDTHEADYMDSCEGRHLPVPHCIRGTEGWALQEEVAAALEEKGYTPVEKESFGSLRLPGLLRESLEGQAAELCLIGLCTDICVVSNALLLKASFPEWEISVDSACCAGVSPETHRAALTTMGQCQINII